MRAAARRYASEKYFFDCMWLVLCHWTVSSAYATYMYGFALLTLVCTRIIGGKQRACGAVVGRQRAAADWRSGGPRCHRAER